MTLSLSDIQEKQFHVRFRGFDIDEVDGFLEVVSQNYALLLDEKRELTNRLNDVTGELERIKNQESSFRNAIISAQNVADEMRKKGQEEANDLLRKAQEEIKALKDEAHKEVTELETRVEELKGMQVQFEDDIKKVIQTYQDRVERIQSEEVAKTVVDSPANAKDEGSSKEEDSDKGPNLSDLYEKIELGDDLAPLSSELYNDTTADDRDGKQDNHQEANLTMPDLDDDVMFTLRDPLDDEDIGIDVPIATDHEEK